MYCWNAIDGHACVFRPVHSYASWPCKCSKWWIEIGTRVYSKFASTRIWSMWSAQFPCWRRLLNTWFSGRVCCSRASRLSVFKHEPQRGAKPEVTGEDGSCAWKMLNNVWRQGRFFLVEALLWFWYALVVLTLKVHNIYCWSAFYPMKFELLSLRNWTNN